MKLVKPLFFLFYFFLLPNLVAESVNCCSSKFTVTETTHLSKKKSQTVYICTGAYAYAYHSNSNCAGLNNCKGQIQYTDENYAVYNLERVPCCRCWTNVSGRCKDDNPYYGGYGGSDDSEAYAYLAMAIMATSAIILSNDIYLYPLITFSKSNQDYVNFDSENSRNEIINGIGLGFRKTFDHSALEYGLNLYQSTSDYSYYGDESSFWDKLNRTGFYFNFAHEILYNKTSDRLRFFIGPATNYFDEFGYGGILGLKIGLSERLSFDVRYENTTQTNQIQMGLIYTYQKKYFWNK